MSDTHHKWVIAGLLMTGLLLQSCYKEAWETETLPWGEPNRVLAFDMVFAFTDPKEDLLLYTLPSDTVPSFRPYVSFGDYHTITFNGIKLIEGQTNNLGQVVINHPYSVTAQDSDGSHTFNIYFTTLPLIHIYTEKKIPDEPKLLSFTEIQYIKRGSDGSETSLFESISGVEIRGRTSAQHEKKSYGLELWENWYGKDCSASLLGMRKGEDWILDAMYIDPLRMRNKLSFELWEKIWTGQNEFPWRTSNPGIQCEFIELFINQEYMGLFCLSEKMDEKLLHLTEGKAGEEGVMYKAISWIGGATAFSTYHSEPASSLIWEGWEQICPDDHFCWEPLADLRKMAVLKEDEVFIASIDSLIDMNGMANYYLFANLLLAHDNILKNYFMARYPEESRFLIVPWDLEGTWGIMWDGEPCSTNGLVENGLYKRLIELDVGDFNDLLESKWEDYRKTTFQIDSLMAPALRYAEVLKLNGAIERENRRWVSANIDIEQELDYFSKWLRMRLKYLDLVFE